ncbi:MAG: LysR family transcriptional regulator [Myxococcales bacterium]|nr:LysR family transcriptional regulator [Myxococcales bacterium]
MDWNDVRYFLALARFGSVRAAGAHLGVSHSTVARRVDAFEEQLGTRLFDRHRDGFQLTDAGLDMVPGAERVEAQMAALERGLAGQDARLAGPVRVTCCDTFVSGLLMSALRALCDGYPEVELGLQTDARAFDLSKREADIAIRTLAVDGRPADHLIGQKVAPVVYGNYVAAAHADRLDPDVMGDRSRWIAFSHRRSVEAIVAASSYPELPLWGSFSSIRLMVQAARQGLGIAKLPTYAADPDPALIRLAQPDLVHVADLWLVSHPDLRGNRRLREARSCVRDALLAHHALFEGTSVTTRR